MSSILDGHTKKRPIYRSFLYCSALFIRLLLKGKQIFFRLREGEFWGIDVFFGVK